MAGHAHSEFQNVAWKCFSWSLKELAFVEIVEWGVISKHCCPSCGQGVPSCFTFGSTLAVPVKLGNLFLASLFVVLPKCLSRFQASCYSKCWHWWHLVESDECRTEVGILGVVWYLFLSCDLFLWSWADCLPALLSGE